MKDLYIYKNLEFAAYRKIKAAQDMLLGEHLLHCQKPLSFYQKAHFLPCCALQQSEDCHYFQDEKMTALLI